MTAPPPRWFKGNLHMHSFWSDGQWFPEMIADWFKERGYNFIAFTEHDTHQTGDRWREFGPGDPMLNDYVDRFGEHWVQRRQGEARLMPLAEYRHLFEEPGRFLIINGEEVTTSWGPGGTDHSHWINVFNAPRALGAQHSSGSSSDAMKQTFGAAAALGSESGRVVVAHLNHPNYIWNATAEDIAGAPSLTHMEIHTALDCAWTYGDDLHASAEQIWDIVLAHRLSRPGGGIVFGTATDDCHRYHAEAGTDMLPGRAWIMVRCQHLTPDRVMSAVRRGDFYCSSGVTLSNVRADAEGIRIDIEAVEGVSYKAQFIGTRVGCDLTSAPVLDTDGNTVRTTRRYSDEIGCVFAEESGPTPSYEFTGDELYVRAVVISDADHPNPTIPGDPQKAWTQPARPGEPQCPG